MYTTARRDRRRRDRNRARHREHHSGIADQLGVQALDVNQLSERLHDRLARTDKPLGLVVDALDEALEPNRLVGEVLAPLAAMARQGAARLVIATRPELSHVLPSDVTINLDEPRHATRRDIARYVTNRLRAHERWAHIGKKSKALLASAVATNARGSFLIARLLTEALLERDPSDLAPEQLPATLGDALDLFIDGLSDGSAVRHVLTALAWAEGAGLPWDDLWPAVASSIWGTSYRRDDIVRARRAAGPLIVERVEDDHSVYTLLHDVVAAHLRGVGPADAPARILDALLKAVPRDESGKLDWSRAHPYIRRHTATFAARSGAEELFGRLLQDASYLVAADPVRLLRAMPAVTAPAAVRARRVYEHSVHALHAAHLEDRASVLEMSARQLGVNDLADAIVRVASNRAWEVPWARWSAPSAHFIAGRHTNGVSALTFAELNGQTVIVSGSYDGTLGVWDLTTGDHLVHINRWADGIQSNNAFPTTFAVTELNHRDVLVSGHSDGSIRLWDLDEASEYRRFFTAHRRAIGGHHAAVFGP